jgi:hypothetical protein
MPIGQNIAFMDNITMVMESEPEKGSFFTMTLLPSNSMSLTLVPKSTLRNNNIKKEQ